MNVVTITGNIISDIDYKFVIQNPYCRAVARFKIEIDNKYKDVLNVKAYNGIADFLYSHDIKKIAIEGSFENPAKSRYGVEILAKWIEVLG